MLITPNMGLLIWNLDTDSFQSEELANTLIKVDLHDHTEGKGAPIGTAAIADGAITPEKLAAGVIADVSIPDGAITAAKLANNSVASANVINGSLVGADLANGTVTASQLADGGVTRAKTAQTFIQAQRVTTSAASTVVNWATSFGDANYTVVAVPSQTGIDCAVTAKSATTVTIGTPGLTGTITLYVIAVHD
jgi:hypothetical protein